ncbi:MAG: M24 family metallopeptidase, partial [Raoultibacter sp.]
MTERAIQIELEDFMVRQGARSLAFSSIVATGANGASPHAIPGQTRLEAGQCVVLDFGARALGYCSDMTRTVFLGAPQG